MSRAKVDLTGQRFEKLLVIAAAPNKGRYTMWECVCDCGQRKIIGTRQLRAGNTKSCGCLVHQPNNHNLQHGLSFTPTHISWTQMIQRCKTKEKVLYHGRGIKVCKRWLKFKNFLADMGIRPEGKTLDRKDNDGDYCPSNCRWATQSEQLLNRRLTIRVTFNGETKPLTEFAIQFGIQPQTARRRLRSGWPIEQILYPGKYHRWNTFVRHPAETETALQQTALK